MAYLNDADAPPSVRTPLLRVLNGGQPVPGAISASIESANHYQADTFTTTFALYADPAYGASWWGTQVPLLLDVQVALALPNEPISWTSLIIGEVDHVSIHPATGLVDVSGRDLTARLIEAKTQETFKNQTSSQIATTLAGRHALTPVVTATKTLVGRYYEVDHDHTTNNEFGRTTTEWDLLTYLAHIEDFDCFVHGTSLYFQPRVLPTAPAYLLKWTPPADDALMQSNAIDLRLERSLTLAKDIKVIVKSWSSKQGRSFEKSATGLGTKKSKAIPGGTSTQQYVLIRPNLTEDQALKLAQSTLAELTKHERIIHWHSPADLILTPRQMVQLQGTQSDFDQVYYIDTISRHIDFDGGFPMDVTAKNHSVGSETVLS